MAVGDKTDPSKFGPHPDDWLRGKPALTLTSSVEVIPAQIGAKIVAERMSISNISAVSTEVILLDGDTETGYAFK